MAAHSVDWVDAFTDRPFGGNGCAVVHDAGTLSAATCMEFVRETSLVECTFLEPSDVADVRVRYYPGKPRDSLCRASDHRDGSPLSSTGGLPEPAR